MTIELERMNKAVHFQARNEDGLVVNIDGAPGIGGENKGFRPMQLVAAALAGCTLMDLVGIIEKYRMRLENLQVEVNAKRRDATPAVFEHISLHYRFWGDFEATKLERALDLAVRKYCSVGAMLEKTAKIDYSYEIVQEEEA